MIQLERLGLDGVDTVNEMGQFDFQGYTITLRDPEWEEAGAKELGSLWSGDKDNLPPLPTDVNAPGSPTLELGADELAVFYRAPVIWAFGQEIKERSIRIEVRGPNMDEDDPPIKEVEFTLHKPPLVLVHGVRSGQDTWDAFAENIENTSLLDINLWIPEWSPSGFAADGIDVAVDNIASYITTNLERLRSESEIAASRVDYLGHSYGGLIGRWYISQYEIIPRHPRLPPIYSDKRDILPLNSESRYYRYDNYGTGAFRLFMTIGTPHQGSSLADILANVLRGGAGKTAERAVRLVWRHKLGSPVVDAISDLSENGNVVGYLNLVEPSPANSLFFVGRAEYGIVQDIVQFPGWLQLIEQIQGVVLLPWNISDRIVLLSSQGNALPLPSQTIHANHVEETSNLWLIIIVIESIHSQNLLEFSETSSGPGMGM